MKKKLETEKIENARQEEEVKMLKSALRNVEARAEKVRCEKGARKQKIESEGRIRKRESDIFLSTR